MLMGGVGTILVKFVTRSNEIHCFELG